MSENKAPYIEKAILKGYKSIKDLEINLLPGLNIIIGANGSGKSNFLEFVEKMLSDQKNGTSLYSKVNAHLIKYTN